MLDGPLRPSSLTVRVESRRPRERGSLGLLDVIHDDFSLDPNRIEMVTKIREVKSQWFVYTEGTQIVRRGET